MSDSISQAKARLRRAFIEAGVLISLTGLAVAGTYFYHEQRPPLYQSEEPAGEGEISVAEARKAMENFRVLWVDARVKKAYDSRHIPGALHMSRHEGNFEDLKFRVAMAAQEAPDKLVIVYCDGKKCEASHDIAKEIISFHLNPNNVKVLRGGWDVWAEGL